VINIRVAEMMGRHRLTKKALSEITGIRPNTVSALWHGTIKRLDMNQLNKLCSALDCQPGDLFEYLPD
jgi:putative transcriptional regulator